MRDAVENPKADMIPLKCRAIEEKISPADLLRVLIHTANHRGYRDFYEPEETKGVEQSEESDEDDPAAEEDRKNTAAANTFDKAFKASGCPTVSVYLKENYSTGKGNKVDYRNRFYKNEDRIIIRRKHMEEETKRILSKQAEYYPELTEEARKKLFDILFEQRDFEDGPGDAKDEHRRYKGFLSTIGHCRFYPDEFRGFRNTVLGDLYAAVNALSQYRYVNTETGEYGLTEKIAGKLINYILSHGSISRTQMKKLLKDIHVEVIGSKEIDKTLGKSFKFIKSMKKLIDATGLAWEEFISEDQMEFSLEDMSFLNSLGDLLSRYQTPRRREQELKKLKALTVEHGITVNEKFWKSVKGIRASGTANASYHHMADAIEAFKNGDIYGNFQWGKESARLESEADKKTRTIPVSVLMSDEDVKDNPVVLRSINETRKIVNALIGVYGTPAAINIEVAKDVAKSYLERNKEEQRQKKNEAENTKIRKEIAGLLKCEPDQVKGPQIERFRLYKEQEGKCMYSGKELNLEDVLNNEGHVLEVDHIIPFSLVLDNTLQNKALVYGSENQKKGQRTPLMYLTGDKAENFKARVKAMSERKSNPLKRKKVEYLLTPSIYGKEMAEKLSEWKSRNINDTRYITKYIVGLFKHHLAGDPQVFGIRGHITSRFRREWLNKGTWGSEEKNRKNNLNHAADAVIIACLTPADVEIAMDHEKLNQIYRYYGHRVTKAYENYLGAAARKMAGFYHMDEEEAKEKLLGHHHTVSIIPRLSEEVDMRFGSPDGETRSEEDLAKAAEEFYQGTDDFIMKPYLAHVSVKPERKFRGTIADSNPIRLIDEDGKR